MLNKHITINDLKQQLSEKTELPLEFYFDGSTINPGYHVTEVKFASIKSIDCGRASGTEQWDEITVQLLDGSADSKQGHMPCSKFMSIVGKALEKLQENGAPFLFFEYAPDNGPIRKLSIESITTGANEVSISLGSEQAECKPFQRFKAAQAAAALSGSIMDQPTEIGCCSDGSRAAGRSCCG